MCAKAKKRTSPEGAEDASVGSVSFIRKRAKRAIIASQKARRTAGLAQIPFDFAQGRLSLRKKRLLGMTKKLY